MFDLAGVVKQPVLVHFEGLKQQPFRQAVAPHKIVGPPPAVARQHQMAGIDPEPAFLRHQQERGPLGHDFK